MEVAKKIKEEIDVSIESVVEEASAETSINLSDADVNYISPEKKSKGGSFIWNYLKKINKLKARCKCCTVILQTPTDSTSALIRHFQSKHSAVTKSAKFEREGKRRVVTPLDPTSQKATEMTRGLVSFYDS